MQVEMPPRNDRSVADSFNSFSFALRIGLFIQCPCQEKIVPTDYRVFDKPSAALGDFLIFLLALNELVAVAEGNGLCKFMPLMPLDRESSKVAS